MGLVVSTAALLLLQLAAAADPWQVFPAAAAEPRELILMLAPLSVGRTGFQIVHGVRQALADAADPSFYADQQPALSEAAGRLQVVVRGSNCSKPPALQALAHEIGRAAMEGAPPLTGVIGPWCSGASKSTGVILGALEIPQISFGSESSDLSNKDTYPYFLRTCPAGHNEARLRVELCKQFAWDNVAQLTAGTDYGKSIKESTREYAAAAGINIGLDLIYTVYTDSSAADMAAKVRLVKASGYRVIIFTADWGDDGKAIMRLAEEEGMLGEGWMWLPNIWATDQEDGAIVRRLRGALQVAFDVSGTPGGRSFQGRLRARLAADPAADPGGSTVTPSAFFAYDAALAFIRSLAALGPVAAGNRNAPLKDALAAQDFAGVTGSVTFDANYDRLGIHFKVMNFQPDPANATQTVRVEVARGVFGDAAVPAINEWLPGDVVWPGGAGATPASFVPFTPMPTPAAPEPEEFPYWALVVAVVALVATAVPVVWRMTENQRRIAALYNNNRVAEESAEHIATMELDQLDWLFALREPNRIQAAFMRIIQNLTEYRKFLPHAVLINEEIAAIPAPTGEVALVFTDIKSSTFLWENVPEAMDDALTQHNRIIRKGCQTWRGYEVKTIGDAFFIAFQDPVDAVTFGLYVQEEILNAPLPEGFEELELTREAFDVGGSKIWGGLRVRMGCHYGNADREINPHTGRSDYRGQAVNKASRFETNGIEGMVTISQECRDAIMLRKTEIYDGRFIVKDAGMQDMKGLGKQCMYAVVPPSLAGRPIVTATTVGSKILLATHPSSKKLTSPMHLATTDSQRQRQSAAMSTVTKQTAMTTGSTSQGTHKDSVTTSLYGGVSMTINEQLRAQLIEKESTMCTVSTRLPVMTQTEVPRAGMLGSYNILVASVCDAARQVSGTVLSVSGGLSHVVLNTSILPCVRHIYQGLRLVEFVADRAGGAAQVSCGVCAGAVLSGNVGMGKRRYTIATGVAFHASVQLAAQADAVAAPSLAAFVGPPQSAGAATIAGFCRMVDVWGMHGTVIHIHQPMRENMEDVDIWGLHDEASFRDGSRPEADLAVVVMNSARGDAAALASLDRRSQQDPSDKVLRSMLALFRKKTGSEPYRIAMPGLVRQHQTWPPAPDFRSVQSNSNSNVLTPAATPADQAPEPTIGWPATGSPAHGSSREGATGMVLAS